MAREAKELARQRAGLEAQLAAERGNAQGHGYTPTPLATPKPAKVCLKSLGCPRACQKHPVTVLHEDYEETHSHITRS